jgi:hypothetical protein
MEIRYWVVDILIDSCRCCCCQIRWKLGIWVVDILIDSCRCCCCQNWMEIRLLGCWIFWFDKCTKNCSTLHKFSIHFSKVSKDFKCSKLTLWRWAFMGTYLLAYYRSFICLPLCLSTK